MTDAQREGVDIAFRLCILLGSLSSTAYKVAGALAEAFEREEVDD